MSDLKSTAGRLLAGSFPRYLIVGVLTSLLDLSLFSLQTVIFGLHPVPSNVVSTVVTVCVSYVINRRFVFRAERSTWRTFISFAGVTLVTGLFVQSAVIWGLVHGARALAPSISSGVVMPAVKVIAMGVGAMCNYLGYRSVFGRGGKGDLSGARTTDRSDLE